MNRKRTPLTTSAPAREQRQPLLAPNGSGLQDTYYTGVALGPSGSGKTTFAENLALYYHRLGGKVWAIDPNGAWAKVPGVKSLWPENGTDGIDDLLLASERWGPGLMIPDDADRYARPNRISQVVYDYMTSNRHMQKDQLWIARRPQGLPKDLFGTFHFLALFAGALMEPGAYKYLSETFPDEILDSVPVRPFHYLLITRNGGQWLYEKRKTKPRMIRNHSDKE